MSETQYPVFETDEEWEAWMKGLNDDEMVAYSRHVHKTFVDNPEIYGPLPAEEAARIAANTDQYERSVRNEKIALQNKAIADAKLARSADQYLAALDNFDNSKGN